MVRATDAKEVGVENPAEETFCHPNRFHLSEPHQFVNARDRLISVFTQAWQGMNLCGAHPFASNPLAALGCVSSHLSWHRDRRAPGLSAQEPPGTARCGNAKPNPTWGTGGDGVLLRLRVAGHDDLTSVDGGQVDVDHRRQPGCKGAFRSKALIFGCREWIQTKRGNAR